MYVNNIVIVITYTYLIEKEVMDLFYDNFSKKPFQILSYIIFIVGKKQQQNKHIYNIL